MALDAATPEARQQAARTGLALRTDDFNIDTRMLLMRELYRAHLDLRQLVAARDVARAMAELGPLADVAHHDAARVLAALGEMDEAVAQQRQACLAAPEDRRAFQYWSLATLEHFAGDVTSALESLTRAERWAVADGALVRAHRAYVILDSGGAVDEATLAEVERSLTTTTRGAGYGQFLLGMIAARTDRQADARRWLSEFVSRAQGAPAAKVLTLREELRRARLTLAELGE